MNSGRMEMGAGMCQGRRRGKSLCPEHCSSLGMAGVGVGKGQGLGKFNVRDQESAMRSTGENFHTEIKDVRGGKSRFRSRNKWINWK